MASRKDYEAVVDAIHEASENGETVRDALAIVSLAMSNYFGENNPRFSRATFLYECAIATRNADNGED